MANDLKRWDGDPGEQRRLGRPVSRICVQIVLLLLVFVLGVLLGSRYGGLLGLVPESANRGWSGQSPSVDADSEVGARAPEHLDETDPERLLQYIDQQLKGALAERKWLASAAKEGRIAYNLLRQRGYSDDSYACQRLIAGQKRFDVAIELAEQKIAEAQRC